MARRKFQPGDYVHVRDTWRNTKGIVDAYLGSSNYRISYVTPNGHINTCIMRVSYIKPISKQEHDHYVHNLFRNAARKYAGYVARWKSQGCEEEYFAELSRAVEALTPLYQRLEAYT